MSFISNNAYRVLGVCSNASLKDIQKNISQLKAFAKIGKEMDLGYNLSFLNLANIDRKDDLLLRSENQLNLDKNKITSSLFWFADLSPIDAVALAHLIKADVSKAIEIWDKATTSKEVSLNNYSAFNNLSTLLLLSTLDDSKTDTFKKDTDSIKQIKKAIKLKNEFISSTFFNNYCESISKSTPLSSDAAQDFFTNTILDLFNKNFSPKELSDLFEGLDDKLKDTLNASLTEAPISNIKNHIETASELIKKNEKSGIKVGKQLIKDTLKDIKYLKEISSPDDFQFQTLSDQLSNQIMQCGIACFNATNDDQDYLGSYQYALTIATGDKTKERAKECITHCENEKEKANQNRLIQLIQNFDKKYKKWNDDKAAAIKSYKLFKRHEKTSPFHGMRITRSGPPMERTWDKGPNLPSVSLLLDDAIKLEMESQEAYAKLVQQYNQDNELVLDIGTGIINRVVNIIVMAMNEQIEIANRRDHNPFLSQNFSITKFEKIKKQLEFLNQLTRRLSKITGNSEANTYLINTTKSLSNNLKTINQNLNNSYQKPTASNPKSEGCYIATMAYGDYNHPQVLELRKFRDEILERSLIGRVFIRCYYSISPRLVEYLQCKYRINFMIKKILDNFINHCLK